MWLVNSTYALNVVSQFMHNSSKKTHECYMNFKVHESICNYNDRNSTSRHFTFVGGNLNIYKSMKQKVVTRSSVETILRGIVGLCEGKTGYFSKIQLY